MMYPIHFCHNFPLGFLKKKIRVFSILTKTTFLTGTYGKVHNQFSLCKFFNLR